MKKLTVLIRGTDVGIGHSHPLLRKCNDRTLLEIMTERIRSISRLSSIIYVSKSPPTMNLVRKATFKLGKPFDKFKALGIKIIYREEPELIELLHNEASNSDFFIVLDAHSPFISPELTKRALSLMEVQNRDFITFTQKLGGLTPCEINRSSILSYLEPSALRDVGQYSKHLEKMPNRKDSKIPQNRYFDDRVSLTPTGEYWEDFCGDFRRLFDNWIVKSNRRLDKVLKVVQSFGADEPNDQVIEQAIEKDMEKNRSIIMQAVESCAKGTQTMRDANSALCRWEARQGIRSPQSFPISVWLGVTDICNARCRFCRYCPEVVEKYKVEINQFKKLDWLRFVTRLYLHCGLGEPFAHPRIAELLGHCRENFPALSIRTSTNGSLLSESLNKIIAGYMTSVNISINAAIRETYERTMPPLKWNETINNLRMLHKEKKRLGTDKPEVNMTYVAHFENIKELPKLPALAASLGVHQIGVVHFKYKISDYIDYLFPETHSLVYHKDLYDQSIRQAKQEATNHGVRLVHPPLFSEMSDEDSAMDLPVGPEFGFQAGDNICYHPWTRIFITPQKSKFTFCCTFGVEPVGEFNWPDSKSFHKRLWNKEPMLSIRQTLNRHGEIPACVFCKNKNKRDPRIRTAWRQSIGASLELYKKWGYTIPSTKGLSANSKKFIQETKLNR
ncbi:radical SAM protein [Planctomycetota bacterium]